MFAGYNWCFGRFEEEVHPSQLHRIWFAVNAEMEAQGIGRVWVDDRRESDTFIFHLDEDKLNDLQRGWFQGCCAVLSAMDISHYVRNDSL